MFCPGLKTRSISLIILRNVDVAYLISVLTAGGSQFYICTFYLWRRLILNKGTYGVVSTYGVGVYIRGQMTEWKRKDTKWSTRFASNGEGPNTYTWKQAWLIRKYKEGSIYVHNYGINTIYRVVSTYGVVSTYRDGWGSEEGKKGNTKYVAALSILVLEAVASTAETSPLFCNGNSIYGFLNSIKRQSNISIIGANLNIIQAHYWSYRAGLWLCFLYSVSRLVMWPPTSHPISCNLMGTMTLLLCW